VDREQGVAPDGRGHREFTKRALEPPGVPVEVDELAAEDAGDLIDAVGEQKTAVEDRDAGLGFGQICAVDVYDAGNGLS